MKQADSYEIAVGREEAGALAARINDALPELAIPGAQIGVGLSALALVIRGLVDSLPVSQQDAARRSLVTLIMGAAR